MCKGYGATCSDCRSGLGAVGGAHKCAGDVIQQGVHGGRVGRRMHVEDASVGEHTQRCHRSEGCRPTDSTFMRLDGHTGSIEGTRH